MNTRILILIAAVGTASLSSAAIYTSELGVNPFMSGADYTGWATADPWRTNGGSDNLVFDLETAGPTGFFAASQSLNDLTATGAHLADPNYDVNTTELTGLTFNAPFFGEANAGAAGVGLDVDFFVEFDLVTTAGTYRAKSQEINNPWEMTGAQPLTMTWQGGGFLGDPFALGGIILADIVSMADNNFMNVTTNNASGTGTVFFLMDNISISYELTTVPEPSTFAGFGGLTALGMVMLRRRFRRRSA